MWSVAQWAAGQGEGQLQVGPLQPSGRVIAGGRLLLACLFLVAVLSDASQPARAHVATYALLGAYVGWAMLVTLLVWNDWWRDAKLAAPAHVIDVAVFMVMLYSTEGYTSPYFTFFIFILLSAAIRWGWKETAITALAVIAVYFTVGMMVGPAPEFDVQRFIVRTGHLLIISAILVWFGANQWIAWPQLRPLDEPGRSTGGDRFLAALEVGMAAVGARRGTLLWREAGNDKIEIVSSPAPNRISAALGGTVVLPELPGSLLFDVRRDHVLMRADTSGWRFLRASEIMPSALGDVLDGPEGLAIPIATGTTVGLAVFQSVRGLSTDHLDFAARVGREMGSRLQESALFAAVEERSMGKARIAVARDLHDSVVQFLAGLSFQLEALKRSADSEGTLVEGLAELKDSVMSEQRQLRAFIRGLRTGKPISLLALSRDCKALCELLARQWNIDCRCTCVAEPGLIPLRTQLDIQQLVREAVANAVRHGGASRVEVSIGRKQDSLCLTVTDNGRGFASAAAGEEVTPPASLSGRVREANGEIEIGSTAEGAAVVIRLPMEDSE
jgi:signal transduction histidine kinase